ncbi:MAG TPA: maleylpyruvate isomerase family mycothiol-dependent enzyme [Streptosporangiaceae bacterium]|nr:maleylpyruvate isomerase family mycothiol-dependent enzyme [Streptosporangiaceae bacterium]
MSEWNAMTYAGKGTILRVVRDQAQQMFALAEQPGVWEAPTACESWEVRDVIGHLVDTMEGYFKAFEVARSGATAANAFGLLGMHERAGDSAKSFRHLSQQEMMTRVRADVDQMMSILEPLNEEQWTSMIVPHFYMGPVPAFIYAAGQLMDYGVHTWDIRQGTGRAHALSADAADLLVPFMFIIWQSTIRPDADRAPFTIGISVTTGHNAGTTRVTVNEEGMSYEPGSVDDLPAVIEFDAGSMVLTAFGRINGGTIRGDQALADRFLNLFYRI